MDDLIEEYLRTLDSTTIDCFRSLFYEASDKQLEGISEKYEGACGLSREWIYDDGVQANMIRWLGEELILISLYHAFEKQLKEIIRYRQSCCNGRGREDIGRLHRWKDMKKYIPECVKNLNDYQQVNTLRVLVNCLKHAGIVNDELNRRAPSFGNIGDEIAGDLGALYEEYKTCASNVIKQTYETIKLARPPS
jgi:hypothetical protein